VLILDLVLGAVIVASVGWGVTRGMSVDALAVVGAGVGAVVGVRVAMLLLNGGLHATDAPEAAIPAAGIGAVIGAMIAERAGLRAHRTLSRLGPAEAVGGAVLGCVLGVAVVWVLGGVLAQVGSLRADVRRSEILGNMYAVLAPPGPSLAARIEYTDPFPTFHALTPAGPVKLNITFDPRVQTAIRSLVRIQVSSCQHHYEGTGWIAADGTVVTNAHVIAAAQSIEVQLHGGGPFHRATPVWFQPKLDIAVLHVPALSGRPALPTVARPRAGTPAAIIGYPLGIFADRPALLGETTTKLPGFLDNSEKLPPEFSPNLFGRPITEFLGLSQPGNSGSPLVDSRGRVLAVVFAGDDAGSGMAVPIKYVRNALSHAGLVVSTGPCPTGEKP
jgi:uncharacterized membrane protein required for colicin V production